MAWFSMYSCSWWPTRYSPSTTMSAAASPASTSPLPSSKWANSRSEQERVEDRRQALGAQADVMLRGAKDGAVGCRQQADRLCLVLDLAAHRHEDRLVVLDEAHHVVAGDVLGGDDHDLAPVVIRVEVDPQQPGVGLGRADRGAVPRSGEDEVVGVLGQPGELLRPLAAEGECGPGATGRQDAERDHERCLRRGGRPHGLMVMSRARGAGRVREAHRSAVRRPPPAPR